MIVPLISNGNIIGLIDISGRKTFTDFDLDRIKIISEQLVTAIKRKKIEDDLKEAYEELNQVFNASIDGMSITGKDFTVLKVNKVLIDIYGFFDEDIVGRKCYEVFYGPECHSEKCVLRRILNGEEYITVEVMRKRKNGEKITCTLSANPLRNKNGDITGVIECFKDITLSKEAFKKIKSDEERFRELFENMSSGVVVYKAENDGNDFIIRDFNKAAEEIEKIKREDVIGRNVLEAFPGIKDFGIFDVFKRVYRTGKPEKYPLSFYKDCRISGWRRNYVYRLPSGEVVTVYDDMTRQKRAEQLLKDSEEFSSSLMENSPNPIYVVNPDYSIKYINPAMENLIGLKSNVILGKKPPYPWWPEERRKKYKKLFSEDMKKGCSGREILLVNSMEKEFWVETYVKPVYSNGDLKFILINWFDITHRKIIENDLKESYSKLSRTLQSTIKALGAIVETKDPYTSGHQKRVSKLAVAISKELGMESEIIESIKTASDIHDIGKINIPASILNKPGKLTELEFDMIKTHPRIGYDMVKEIEFQVPIAKIILQHHEKLDGSGYPDCLKAKDIMFEAKILTVADVVEAMSSDRPYRPSLGLKAALEEIKRNRGKLYDPGIVDACVKVVTRKGFKFE